MSASPFGPLRASLFALLGLAACGGSVATSSELDPKDAGDGKKDAAVDARGDAGPGPSLCENPQELVQRGGSASGFVRCADGSIQRVASRPADPSSDAPSCVGTETTRSCDSDADCAHLPNGRCISIGHINEDGTEAYRSCGCHYTCASDADCPDGGACIPGKVIDGKPVSFCASANCRTGADCASGECGLSLHDNGCWLEVSLACRDEGDACRSNLDCAGTGGTHCAHSEADGWHCQGPSCAIGRPLLIAGSARIADAEPRADWASSLPLPDPTGLDLSLRQELARHWLDVAAMEHASIGSFARFSLQLLALGAPPDLLADTQQAALDEVEHARIAYGLASAYAGRAFGPGALDMSGVEIVTCRREALRSLITEACVNETLGVAEALAIAERVSDPALAKVHRRIAEDERRHAELAWRTLAWLLESADDDLLDEAARAFAEATAAMEAQPSLSRAVAPEHGLLSADELLSLRRQTLREVVTPCASGLLEQLKMAA